jgi:hypothetical protein
MPRISDIVKAIEAAGGDDGLNGLAVSAQQMVATPAFEAAVAASRSALSMVLQGLNGEPARTFAEAMDAIFVPPLVATAQSEAMQIHEQLIRAVSGSDIHSIGATAQGTLSLSLQRLCGTAELASISAGVLSSLDFQNLGAAVNMSPPARDLLEGRFVGFARSYSQLYLDLERRPPDVEMLKEELWELPAQGFFCSVDAICAISLGDSDDEADRILEDTRDHIAEETQTALKIGLREVDPDLIPVWQGAQEAIALGNPDRSRHLCSSLRQLITSILELLAPADRVREWNANPEFYTKSGQPTRKARLRYIWRHRHNETLPDYVEKEIDVVLLLLGDLNRGVHSTASPYDRHQLTRFKAAAEAAIRLVLMVRATRE